ncbi:MAG: hypothetical protein Q8M98_08300 [Candidatus Cloacimonadaceae bacterium]|nr:hypothetical protein [Candidatus Cloacimonadaceae bacterium]MDP3114763.1 hypothetical protein [Candidatus Cloacimonadaceae bacterium]
MYKLPNGRQLKLEEVESVSRVKDLGQDTSTIGYSRLGFSIFMKSGRTVDVVDKYHFSDWADVKKKLSLIREEIVAKVHAISETEAS